MGSEFPGKAHRLDDLFRDEQRRIIGIVLADRFEDYQRSFEQLANQDEEVLNRLGHLNYPIPKPLRAAASAYMDHHLEAEITRLERGDETSLAGFEHLHERGKAWGYQARDEHSRKDRRRVPPAHPGRDPPGRRTAGHHRPRSSSLLDASSLLGIKPDLWQVQNAFLERLPETRRHRSHGRLPARDLRHARHPPERQPKPAGVEAVRDAFHPSLLRIPGS